MNRTLKSSFLFPHIVVQYTEGKNGGFTALSLGGQCLTSDVYVNKGWRGAAETYCTPNELPQGRLFLCFKSINNGDERELGLEMMWSSRGHHMGPCQSQGEAGTKSTHNSTPEPVVKFGKTAMLSHLQWGSWSILMQLFHFSYHCLFFFSLCTAVKQDHNNLLQRACSICFGTQEPH